MSNMVCSVYFVFIVSYFLHLPKRFPLLGSLHLDLVLYGMLSVLVIATAGHRRGLPLAGLKTIALLFLYVLLSLPLVRWPGTVMRFGIPNLIGAALFLVFTVFLVNTEVQYRRLLQLFVFCQTFRVLEPLYLHVTTGYWGSATHMGNAEMMNRLAGSPLDDINPNGLAFIITSVLPFLYFFSKSSGRTMKWVYLGLMPVCIYALILTASRTGMLALLIVVVGVILKSNHKALMVGVAIAAVVFVSARLDEIQTDRFRSIYDRGARGSATAQGRIDGVIRNLGAAMKRPLFGHGLGSSAETNANVLGSPMVAHNLYAEILQEIGLVGLVIFCFYIKSIIETFRSAVRVSKERFPGDSFVRTSTDALEVWFWMNILFSFASYGLTYYEWYLYPGISAVSLRLALTGPGQEVPPPVVDDVAEGGTVTVPTGASPMHSARYSRNWA